MAGKAIKASKSEETRKRAVEGYGASISRRKTASPNLSTIERAGRMLGWEKTMKVMPFQYTHPMEKRTKKEEEASVQQKPRRLTYFKHLLHRK